MYERAFIHVGYDKTGSTALQIAAASLSAELGQHSVHFPQPINGISHSLIASAFCLEPHRADFNISSGRSDLTLEELRKQDLRYLQRYEEQIKNGSGTLFLSFEGFIWLSEVEHAQLKNWLLGQANEIRVLIYVRDPISYAESAISQRVRTGRSIKIVHQYHDRDITKLMDVYGREAIIVRSCDRRSLVGGDIRADCFTLLGIERRIAEKLAASVQSDSHKTADSLSMHAIGIADALRQELDGTDFHSQAGYEEAFFNVFDELLRNIPGPKYRLSKNERRELMNRQGVLAGCAFLENEFGIRFGSRHPGILENFWLKPDRARALFEELRSQGVYAGIAKAIKENVHTNSSQPQREPVHAQMPTNARP